MKTYRLLKDLPDWPKGSEISFDDSGLILGYRPESYPDFFEPIYKWPKSYEELVQNVGYIISEETDKQIESTDAFLKLSALAAEMNGDWIPDWKDNNFKFTVQANRGGLCVDSYFTTRFNIVFKTNAAAEFSREHHRELWEQYYMM
jgi:hypothetical protein